MPLRMLRSFMLLTYLFIYHMLMDAVDTILARCARVRGYLQLTCYINYLPICLPTHVFTYLLTYLATSFTDVVATSLARCARYPRGHSCREMFWTAGQRYDLERGPSPFVWKQTPGTGSCCGGTCMEEMDYTYWSRGEPNNRGAYDADLNPTSPPSQEKCMQLCRGWAYR